MLKRIPFKGGYRWYSNRYCFSGGTPADNTHWETLMDNVVAAEHPAMGDSNLITECIGYAANSDVPVHSKTYSQAGTVSPATNWKPCPGEVAALVRWSTAARSTKNHPIYCFSYFHQVYINGGTTDYDTLDANQKSALATYATAWVSGFSDGTHTLVRCSPAGHVATGSLVEEYTTHRDFPYSTSV